MYFIACPDGSYGVHCQNSCGHCLNGNAHCNKVNGRCSGGCSAGWKGDMCDTGRMFVSNLLNHS